jgi:proliferating cell nuclear antigen
MEFQLTNKKKKDVFVSIFQLLKQFTSFLYCNFEQEFLHIQGMDKSHVCLFNVKIGKDWFDTYVVEDSSIKICVDATLFHSILNMQNAEQNIHVQMDSSNQDSLQIQFVTTEIDQEKEVASGKKKKPKKLSSSKKFFKIPLLEYEYEEMSIPDVDYDATMILSSNLVSDIFNQLENFGNTILMKCLQEEVEFISNHTNGEMRVQIPMNDLISYSIIEDEIVQLTYSLLYLTKMCSSKLSEEVEISLSSESPLKMMYDLGNDSTISFYMAPKISDE